MYASDGRTGGRTDDGCSLLGSNGNSRSAAAGRGRAGVRLETMATTMPFVATLRPTNQASNQPTYVASVVE